MNTQLIITTLENHIFTIQLNRPEKRNALTQEMYTLLNEALEQAETNDDIRVIILTGTKDYFTGGNDLQDFMNVKSPDDLQPVIHFLFNLNKISKPFIAAINGGAIGIGSTLLPYCDLAYASKTAYFKMPFVDLGICPEAGSSFLFPRIMGTVRASECLLLAETLTADRAQEFGLINAVIDTESDVLEHAIKQAKKLCKKPAGALKAAKALLRRATQNTINSTITHECDQLFALLNSPESKAIIKSFFTH